MHQQEKPSKLLVAIHRKPKNSGKMQHRMLLQHLYIRNIRFYCPPVEISRVAIDVSAVLQNCGIAIPSTISTEKYLVTSKQYKYMRLLSLFNLMLIWNVHRWQAFLWETSRKQRLYNVYARSIIKIRTDNIFVFVFSSPERFEKMNATLSPDTSLLWAPATPVR